MVRIVTVGENSNAQKSEGLVAKVTHETKVALLEVKIEGARRLSEVGCEDPDAPLSCLADLPECSDEA